MKRERVLIEEPDEQDLIPTEDRGARPYRSWVTKVLLLAPIFDTASRTGGAVRLVDSKADPAVLT